ncbi:MAG TPA: hypothetical protein VL943_12480 [Niabella sp.]|jgi:hypothetical protein|nr:hypothetical protein [Niabella sp.]
METLRMPFLLMLVLVAALANAQQQDTEFTQGWLLNLKLTNGAVTDFKSTAPDAYTGGLSLNPQVTVVPGSLRLGANLGAAYTSKKVSGLFGPMVALKLTELGTKNFGTLANMHLIAEANWGTNRQQMVGGGLGFEILSLAHIGITAQRDYKLNNWWLQSFIAIRFNKQKQDTDKYAR